MRGKVFFGIVVVCLIFGAISITTIAQPSTQTGFEGEIEDKNIKISKTEGGYVIGLCNNLWASDLDVFFDDDFQGTIPRVRLYTASWKNFYVTDKVKEIVVQGTGIERHRKWHRTLSDEDWPPDTPPPQPKSMAEFVVDEMIELAKGQVTAEVLKATGDYILQNSESLIEVVVGSGVEVVGVVIKKTTVLVWVIMHAEDVGGGEACDSGSVIVVNVLDTSSKTPSRVKGVRGAKVKIYSGMMGREAEKTTDYYGEARFRGWSGYAIDKVKIEYGSFKKEIVMESPSCVAYIVVTLIETPTSYDFGITATSEKDKYEPGETAKVIIDVTNNRNQDITIWLETCFEAPDGYVHCPRFKEAEIFEGETESFYIDWTIPFYASLGQYEITVNCWNVEQNEQYSDDLEWAPIFNVGSAIGKSLKWLRTQQTTDGDYVYWTYQGTPNVGITALVTLAFLNHGYDESDPTVKGALNWIVDQTNEDGSISYKPVGRGNIKVYDTSLAILPLVAAHDEDKYGEVLGNAKDFLIRVQNNEENGYKPSNRYYGGWGYPRENWADLSNTQFALMALDATGGLTGDVKDNALTFVERCQNRKESNPDYSFYDDGGFIYRPKGDNFARGKSYGSMTAAGLWGLFLCGIDKDDERLKDALRWLDEHSVRENYPIGTTWVYYYDLGLAKAYLMAEATGCEFEHKDWYEDLYAFLSDKQEEDGHWRNIEGDGSEDVLATAEAILALEVKEIPAKISRLSYIVFKLRSAADLHVYDPQGRHVGLNYETREVEIEILGATYSENPTVIKVPNLEAGGYTAELTGMEAGEYDLEVIAKTGNKTLAEESYEGWITEGATHEMVTTISSIVGPLDVRMGTLKAVVEVEDSYFEKFTLEAGEELEIDAIDETGVLLRIEAEEECEGEVKIKEYSENPTIKGFTGEYKYYALEKYLDISLDVDKEKIDWPIYLEVYYDGDELPENVDENSLNIFHYWNDTKWRSCHDFEVNPEENYISAELEKEELSYFGIGGLYAPIWVRYSMILTLMAIVIVLAVGYYSLRRFVKFRKGKAKKVPEKVPTTAKVEPAREIVAIYNFDNIFSLLEERENSVKILKGLDERFASGEIKEETYNDLKPKYESRVEDINSKIKSELEKAKAHLQRLEKEREKMQKTRENLNEELLKEEEEEKRKEISTKISEIRDKIIRADGLIKTMKEKVDSIERVF